MGTIVLEKSRTETELINAAKHRVKKFPANWIKLYYYDEVDNLFVQISKEAIKNSEYKFENNVVYHYNQAGQVVSFEVLDIFGIFASE